MLLVAFLSVNAPNCHLSLVLASVVQGDAVNCNISQLKYKTHAAVIEKFTFVTSILDAVGQFQFLS